MPGVFAGPPEKLSNRRGFYRVFDFRLKGSAKTLKPDVVPPGTGAKQVEGSLGFPTAFFACIFNVPFYSIAIAA